MVTRILILTLWLVTAACGAVFDESSRAAHAMLVRLCDAHGGRATGTTANSGALEQLAAELRSLGHEPEFEAFRMRGWERGNDSVAMIAPLERTLRVAALAYSEPHEAFEADVVYVGQGRSEEYPSDAQGRVVLLASSTGLQPREYTRIAAERGARGILQINREGGGQLLARTGSFIGEPLAVPAYSITQEEGLWMQRLIAGGAKVRVRMETRSRCVETQSANLRLTLPGESPERILVGAHFDSWDLGQGAVDNGLGIAQLYAIAHALRGRALRRTVELVWFNGEELGLWGSRHGASRVGDTPIVAMINLDMVGVPIAVNALGDASLVAALVRWNTGRGALALERGVENVNWFGSDHTPYQLAGVRAITFNAPIPRDSVRYYHDMADTIDKLPEQLVVESTAVIGDLVLALAHDEELRAFRRDTDATIELFTGPKLDIRMKAIGWWPFREAE
ncbi:MAG TPA: M28 family peptidase [Opitutaceae bacterium]|nr:M28 family peptidase [Opitutaceae bacterium]